MRSIILCLLVSFAVSGQTQNANPVLLGAGNLSPFPISVAPGQLLTLYVQPASPLSPVTISAVSVLYSVGGSDKAVPVLQVNSMDTACNFPLSMGQCTQVLAVTVQMPFDIPVICPLCARPLSPYGKIVVSVAGVKAAGAGVNPLPDQVHFLTSCDTILTGASSPPPTNGGLPCTPVVTHADGRPISNILPAHAGEELVAYATGLGQTTTALTEGQPAAASSPTSTTFAIDFNYRANALATQPAAVGAPIESPLFTGSTKGYVGLYQINFTVPPPPDGLTPCVNNASMPPYAKAVRSNLTISVGSDFSFDGAGICVLPGGVESRLGGS